MAQLSDLDALNSVAEIVNANGGKIKYTALLDALNASGKAQLIPYLPRLKQQRLIVSQMEFETPDAPLPVSFVSVPGGNS